MRPVLWMLVAAVLHAGGREEIRFATAARERNGAAAVGFDPVRFGAHPGDGRPRREDLLLGRRPVIASARDAFAVGTPLRLRGGTQGWAEAPQDIIKESNFKNKREAVRHLPLPPPLLPSSPPPLLPSTVRYHVSPPSASPHGQSESQSPSPAWIHCRTRGVPSTQKMTRSLPARTGKGTDFLHVCVSLFVC